MDRVQRPRRLAIRRFDTAIGSAPCTASCARNAGALVLSELECGSITRRSIEGGCALAVVVVLLHRVFPRKAEAEPKDYVWMARTYIEQNYWKPTLTVTEIVQAVNLERSYLFRRFKAATGESISAYLTSYRIRRACELLKLSGLSIQSIAYSVGYHDPLYFSRVFKKATSHTPSAYMMLHQKK